tara:strand:- start:5041 stop:5526 length:486 start_codon:yes stop_codon:yes gene_type:complete
MINIDTFIILIIFITLLIFIYQTYFRIKNNNNNIVITEPFFDNKLKIDTDLQNYDIKNKGFVNELIPVKNEIDYINPRIHTYYDNTAIGDELISDYKTVNNYNNYTAIDSQFCDCKPKLFINLNKDFIKKHFTKGNSTDLPIGNIHINFLSNCSDKISNNI